MLICALPLNRTSTRIQSRLTIKVATMFIKGHKSLQCWWLKLFCTATEPKIWTYKVVILSHSYTAFFVFHSARVIDKTILLSTRRRHELLQSWLSKATIATMLIMTKTIVHWTEDMNIQSRHPLAQLYSILHIALRLCYWQNHFIEYSCYLQNHLWTTAELTVDNRL
jgi:hypothetical protein